MPTTINEPEHARLSCSGVERWSRCPGSPAAEADYPSTTSEAAAEGTCAHALLEFCLLLDVEPTEAVKMAPKAPAFSLVHDEMLTLIAKVKAEVLKLPGKLLIERRVNPGRIIGLGDDLLWGTADLVLLDAESKTLRICDLKYGKSPVHPKSDQLKLYTLGSLELCDFKPERFIATIFQPRLQIAGKSVVYTPEVMKNFALDIKSRALATLDDDAPRIAGGHCYWCKHKFNCHEFRVNNLKCFNEVDDAEDLFSIADL